MQGFLFYFHIPYFIVFLLQFFLQGFDFLRLLFTVILKLFVLFLQLLKVFIEHESLVFSMDDLRSVLRIDLVAEELLCEYFHTHFGLIVLTLLFLLVVMRSISFILKLVNFCHVDTRTYTR